MPYTIAGILYKTKSAVNERAREILNRVALNEHLGEEDSTFVASLLHHHSKATAKIGPGIRTISVERGKDGTRCFYVNRLDGTKTDFSYLKCLSPPSRKKDLNAALRAVIKPDTDEFKAAALASNPVCAITGEALHQGNAHADHQFPLTFKALSEAFIEQFGIDPKKEPLVYADNADDASVRLGNPATEEDWRRFHREKAQLRLLSAKANLSLGAR